MSLEGFYSDKNLNLKIKSMKQDLLRKPRPKNLGLLGIKNNLTLFSNILEAHYDVIYMLD